MKSIYFTLFFFPCTFFSILFGQNIFGKIHSRNIEPIPNVIVKIPALQRITSSDSTGYFHLENIPRGKYIIEFNRIDYKNDARPVIISNTNIEMDIVLDNSPVEIPAITITANTQPTLIFENPNSVNVISGKDLDLNRGQSVMQTLDWLPGVSLFTGSMLAVKPVIRGFTAQRIIIAEDGNKIEGQMWDEPQSAEIDALDVEKIEVVHGPLSVLYGSDAMGGVVNVLRSDIFSLSVENNLQGTAAINLFSNSTQGSAAVALFGSYDNYFYRANFSGRYAGDYSVPSGTTSKGIVVPSKSVFNSGAQEFDGSARFGMREEWGTVEFDYSHFNQFYFISPEPGRKEYELNIHTNTYDSLPAAPKQEIFHEIFSAKIISPLSIGRLELHAVAQYNSRREEGIAESDADEVLKKEKGIKPEALLDLYTLTIDARLHHQTIEIISGTVGGSITGQRNQTLGMNAIIPNFTSKTISGFLYEEAELSSMVSLVAGLRGDTRSFSVSANDSLRNPQQDITYNSLNGSGGIVLKPFETIVIAANFSTGWRSPVVSELFTRGKDEGTIRYKIGNASLSPELARNAELSLRFRQSTLHSELNIFTTSVQHYIYLDPTGTFNESLPVFTFRQTDATLRGGEFFAELLLFNVFSVNIGYDFLETQNKTLKSPLPLQPANKAKVGISIEIVNNNLNSNTEVSFQNLNLIARMKYVTAQNKVTALETTTPQYTLYDLGLQGECSIKDTPLSFSLLCENVLNTAYYDHLSRYKEYALNPGINVSLKVSTPFTIIH